MIVGRVPDLPSEPFYYDMARRGFELHDMLPNALAPAAETGEIHAGPLPLVDCFRLEDRFQPVGGFCLATTDSSGGVFLYSTRPIEELGDARIATIDEAVTESALLKVLLTLKYQVRPEAYVTLEEPHDAFLLVGNRALRQRRGARGFPHKYDLGQEWHTWTGLPFVYSRWMVTRDQDPKLIAVLEDTLYVGMEEGVDVLYHQNEPRNEVLMLPRHIIEYIQGIRYYIGLSEQKAIDRFRQYLGQLDT
jgi:chorismate dehydratase